VVFEQQVGLKGFILIPFYKGNNASLFQVVWHQDVIYSSSKNSLKSVENHEPSQTKRYSACPTCTVTNRIKNQHRQV
jgi:hypothetical protein